MQAVVEEEIERRNEIEKKLKELEILLETKNKMADRKMSKNLPEDEMKRENILKKVTWTKGFNVFLRRNLMKNLLRKPATSQRNSR